MGHCRGGVRESGRGGCRRTSCAPCAPMERINGSTSAVQEWDEWERDQQAAQRARSKSVADFRPGGARHAFAGGWQSLDEVFPSQPRRFALSNATHREQTQKAPRGPTLRGPRTWMRHRAESPALPSGLEELDRYYTEMQNPIGRSAGTGKWRSNSERVVLAISQPPRTRWRDDQAGPATAATGKTGQGTLLILKVSSGSVSNWRQIKESAVPSREPTRDGATHGALPAAAHLKMPEGALEASEQDRELVKTPGPSPETPARTGSPAIVLSDPPHKSGSDARSPVDEVQHSSAKRSASVTTGRKASGSRGYLGSRLGVASSSRHDTGKNRPLTEAAPTWRNTPSWESTGWYSRGSLLDSATDAQVAPVRKK